MMDLGTFLVLVGLALMALGTYHLLKILARYPRLYPMSCMDCSIPYTTSLVEGSTGLCEGCLSIRNTPLKYERDIAERLRGQL